MEENKYSTSLSSKYQHLFSLSSLIRPCGNNFFSNWNVPFKMLRCVQWGPQYSSLDIDSLALLHNSKKIVYLDIQNGSSSLCITKSSPCLAFLHIKGGGLFLIIAKKGNLHTPIFPKRIELKSWAKFC